MSKLLAQGKHLVVLLLKKKEDDSQIQFIESEDESVVLCEVVSVGEKVEKVNVKVGDKVHVVKNTVNKFIFEEVEFGVLEEDGILTLVE